MPLVPDDPSKKPDLAAVHKLSVGEHVSVRHYEYFEDIAVEAARYSLVKAVKTLNYENSVIGKDYSLAGISFLTDSFLEIEIRRNNALAFDYPVNILVGAVNVDRIDSLKIRASLAVVTKIRQIVVVVKGEKSRISSGFSAPKPG